jgi:hypothetical protein
MIGAFQHLQSTSPSSRQFVLRIDTDALIIAPFADRVGRVFSQNPGIGMMGSYLISPNGKPRGREYWAELLRDMMSPWLRGARRVRTGRHLPTNLWGRPAVLRSVIHQAVNRGYTLGESVLGGAYAISTRALGRLAENGFLNDPLLWLDTALVEDVMMSMLVMAAGMQLFGYAANGEVFGVIHKGLADAPEKLLERGYGIIHSVRNDERCTEEEVRDFFRSARHPQH